MKKRYFVSLIILFLLGAAFHFTYKLSGNFFLVGLISPVNESIWEHTKLAVLPLIIWYLSYLKIDKSLDKQKWLSSLILAIIGSVIFEVAFFYTYSGIIGKTYLIVDMLDLLLSFMVGQWLAFHSYKNNFEFKNNTILIFFTALVTIYFVLTIYPPKIPLFEDPKNL